MLLTFGHGTATAGRMTELLRSVGVAVLIDVRTAPGSRRNPAVARAEMERWLPEAGISYRWDKRLGGFRKAAPDSPDTVWREDDQQPHRGNGPRVMATLRNLSLGLFAINGITKITETVQAIGRRPMRAVQLIT